MPPECISEDGDYTCYKECKHKMPQHCDRYDQTLFERDYSDKTIFDSCACYKDAVHGNQIMKTL